MVEVVVEVVVEGGEGLVDEGADVVEGVGLRVQEDVVVGVDEVVA